MFVKPCPKCGRMPKIIDCVPYKKGIRKRLIGCPNFCSVIKKNNFLYGTWYIIWYGNEDNNTLYKEWNNSLKS